MLTDAAAWSAVQTNSTWHILETKPSAYSTSGVIMEQLPQKAEGKVLGKCWSWKWPWCLASVLVSITLALAHMVHRASVTTVYLPQVVLGTHLSTSPKGRMKRWVDLAYVGDKAKDGIMKWAREQASQHMPTVIDWLRYGPKECWIAESGAWWASGLGRKPMEVKSWSEVVWTCASAFGPPSHPKTVSPHEHKLKLLTRKNAESQKTKATIY